MREPIIREMMIGESLDFNLDWAAKGELPSGVTITASSWVLESGLTLAQSAFTNTTTRGRITCAGTLGLDYDVTNRVTYSDGQIKDFTFVVKVIERIFVFVKDPDSTDDFRTNWQTSVIFATGETIASYVYTVPAGLTLVADVNTDYSNTVRLSGGTLAAQYRVPNDITTTAGQIAKCILLILGSSQ